MAITAQERHQQRRLLEVLLHIGEDYRRINDCDHELFTSLALDAKAFRISDSRVVMRQTFSMTRQMMQARRTTRFS
ncbi:hypothetical protein VSR82_35680 [Burkholderia sp. JPY481]|uniref:hypothetical protein n=1 Tax=Paraburkholderia sp. JPY465 TaxID=3042285 RepID=UPI0031817AA3